MGGALKQLLDFAADLLQIFGKASLLASIVVGIVTRHDETKKKNSWLWRQIKSQQRGKESDKAVRLLHRRENEDVSFVGVKEMRAAK